VHFTADAKFRELLEEVRALASHSLPGGDLLPLMTRALEAYRRELRKNRFGVGTTPKREAVPKARGVRVLRGAVLPDVDTTEGRAKRSRHIAAAVARAVYERDGGCCTFSSEDGRRCGARRFLELDHVEPWAEGGQSTVENIRLRCRAHNQHAARAHFGDERISAVVERARSRA
jgi:hypothetical protein